MDGSPLFANPVTDLMKEKKRRKKQLMHIECKMSRMYFPEIEFQ